MASDDSVSTITCLRLCNRHLCWFELGSRVMTSTSNMVCGLGGRQHDDRECDPSLHGQLWPGRGGCFSPPIETKGRAASGRALAATKSGIVIGVSNRRSGIPPVALVVRGEAFAVVRAPLRSGNGDRQLAVSYRITWREYLIISDTVPIHSKSFLHFSATGRMGS
jgi:hypothetical protein